MTFRSDAMTIQLLTARQCQVIEALIETGSEKGAGRKLGIAARSIGESLRLSRGRTGTKSSLQLAVKYVLCKAGAAA